MMALRYTRTTLPFLAGSLLGVVLLSCGNFATEPDSNDYGDGDADGDSDSDGDSDGDMDGDGDGDGDVETDTGIDTLSPVDTDVDSDADTDIDIDTNTNMGWPCPLAWDTFSCTSEEACLEKDGVNSNLYACNGNTICCDTSPRVDEGPYSCPVDQPDISCQFSWECWKAHGELLYANYYCEGDNTLCCRSALLDPDNYPDTESDTDSETDSETDTDSYSIDINIELGSCGGLSDKERSVAVSDLWNKPYCDAEVVHWKYNAELRSLALLDSRVLLNCCGDHGLAMARKFDGTYLITETDRAETIDRCSCSCVFDYQLTANDIPSETMRVKIVRDVEGEPLFNVWEGDLPLAYGSGTAIVDDASMAPSCDETDTDSATEMLGDAGPDGTVI